MLINTKSTCYTVTAKGGGGHFEVLYINAFAMLPGFYIKLFHQPRCQTDVLFCHFFHLHVWLILFKCILSFNPSLKTLHELNRAVGIIWAYLHFCVLFCFFYWWNFFFLFSFFKLEVKDPKAHPQCVTPPCDHSLASEPTIFCLTLSRKK